MTHTRARQSEPHVICYIQNRTTEVRRGCFAPFNLRRVEGSNVPENPMFLATEFLRTWKLLFQCSRHKVVFVPELHNP